MDKLSLPEPEKIHLGNSYSEFQRIENTSNNEELVIVNGKASHYIDTIEQLNERISNLSYSLDTFGSYDNDTNFDINEDDVHRSETLPIKQSTGNEKERKEVQKFSGVFSFHSALGNDSDNIKQKNKFQKADTSNVAKKPMLVELHSFPGYDDHVTTPLPASLTAPFIMRVVVDAQISFMNKPTFKERFYDFFTSKESADVFKDTFWWFFCHKYQPTANSQDKLFDRIARNYTTLLFSKTQEKQHDKLFKNYGNLIAQAIYATFCHAFPTSYRQFNGEFRDDLINVCVLWTMGTKPRPRSWDEWNFEALEPWGLRKGEKIQEDAAKAKTLDFDLKQVEERGKNMAQRRQTRKFSRAFGPLLKASTSTEPSNTRTIDESGNSNPVVPSSAPKMGKGPKKKQQKESPENTLKQISSVLGMSEGGQKKQSCEIGAGPSYNKVVFNLHGGSPLVTYYLATNNLLKNVGTSVLVQRTEIDKLPPVGSKTYDDVIEETRIKADEERENFENLVAANIYEQRRFSQKRATDTMNFKIRSAKLLSNPKEVRKISDLLRIPENKEEPEENKVRAAKLRSLLVHTLGEDEEY